MSPEEPFLLAIRENPDDHAPRLVYADWLDEHGDYDRAAFIRLQLSHVSIPATQEGLVHRSTIADQMRELRRRIDGRWAATFDEFDCRVWDSETVRVRIHLSGRAPQKYGPHTVKVGGLEILFVLRAGWERVGNDQYHYYFRLPESLPVITLQVPTETEVRKMAFDFHARRTETKKILGPWLVSYSPRHGDGPTGAASFSFGNSLPWSMGCRWEQGDAAPPRWIVGNSQVVRD